MMREKNRIGCIGRKLASDKGESISEVLVSALVIAVSLVLLATMIMASFHMMQRSETNMSAYYDAMNASEKRTVAGTSSSIEISDSDTGNGGKNLFGTGRTVYVTLYSNDTAKLAMYVKK